MKHCSTKYVGLDVHKNSIAVSVAESGREEPIYYGEISNTVESLRKLVKRLGKSGDPLSFCYEAGPCGYSIYRTLTK